MGLNISAAPFVDYDGSSYLYFKTVRFHPDSLTCRTWSPCIWDGGRRAKKNFLYADMIGIDFDAGRWAVQDCIDVMDMAGLWSVIGTTKSHQKPKGGVTCDRFRLVCKFSERITDRDVYEYNANKIIDSMPADSSCQDGARLFFPCTEIVYKRDGLPYPVRQNKKSVLAPGDAVAKRRDYERQFKLIPRWMENQLNSGVPQGERNRSAFRFSLHLKERDFTEGETLNLLSCMVQEGFDENELGKAIASAYRYRARGVY